MSFADDLNKPKLIELRKIKKGTVSEADTANAIIENIKSYCEYIKDDKRLSGYIDNQFHSDYTLSPISHLLLEKKEVFPKRVKPGDPGVTSKHKPNNPREYTFEPSMEGIYSKNDAEYLTEYLSKELNNLGFRNIIVRIEPIKILRVISLRKTLLNNWSYKVKYEDTGEVGYRVYFSINW